MSRGVGVVLMVLGMVLVVLGLLARPVIYPRLAVVPLDQSTENISTGTGMQVLYPHRVGKTPHLDRLDDATVVSTRKVVGVPGRVEAAGVSDDQAFWQTTVKQQADVDGRLVDLSYSDEGVSLDRRSGQSTNCCDDYRSVGTLEKPKAQEPIRHEGYFFKLPFDAQQQDYPWWDGDLGTAFPATFQRVETLEGTRVHVYQQDIPAQVTARRTVPASLFDATATGNVKAEVRYANVRTLWIEPNTGVLLKGQEEIDRSLVVPGQDPVPVARGTIAYTDDTVSRNVDEWGPKGRMLGVIHGPLMPVSLVAGGLLVLLGLVLFARQRRARHG